MSSEILSTHPISDIEEIANNLPVEELQLYILRSPLIQEVIHMLQKILW